MFHGKADPPELLPTCMALEHKVELGDSFTTLPMPTPPQTTQDLKDNSSSTTTIAVCSFLVRDFRVFSLGGERRIENT